MWSQRPVCGLFANNVVSFATIVGPTSRVFVANVGRRVPLFAGQPPDDCGPLHLHLLYASLLTPVASRNLLLYQTPPPSILYRHANVRRQKDDPGLGATARRT